MVRKSRSIISYSKESWDKLQKLDPQFRNDCGSVGVNGGYFDNPNYLFGANCYGKKPNPKQDEIMKQEPETNPELNRIKEFEEKLHEIKILPFNKDKWSQNQ